MAQITTGFRKIFESPLVYNAFQNAVGAQKLRKFYIESYINAARNDKVLDIGCGTGDILTLLPNDVEYVGFDLSEEYIDAARKKFGDRATWHCRSVSDMDANHLQTFDIVMANGVLHHLEDSEAIHLIAIAAKALKPTGRFVCYENAFTNDQSFISRLIVAMDRGQNVRSPAGYAELLSSSFPSVTTNVYHNLLRIPYTHVILVGAKEDQYLK